MTTRWLVTGAAGMLGRDVCAVLETAGIRVTAATRADLDITDHAAVAAAVPGQDVVVNAAAFTAVDAAETAEGEATAVNGTAVGYLADVCRAHRVRLLHVSTDAVLSGDIDTPQPEDAPVVPVNAYGRSKLAGERAALASGAYVVRTAWLYGAHGRNFVTTMLRLAGERERLDVVADQWGQPTWTRALAEQLLRLGRAALAGAAPGGVYHGTAAGHTTWYELARAVFEAAGLDPARVRPISGTEFTRAAPQSGYSVLGHDRWSAAGLTPMGHWRPMLGAFFSATFGDAR